jgi:GTP-binding protein
MVIRTAELETVCGITSDLPKHTLPEVAFCGRSNVGKSSLINALVNRKNLAHTSGEPGKTQTMNYYNLNHEIYLVDLPGYGYAKVAKEIKEKWGKMIQNYLVESENLEAVFVLVDMRHKPTQNDIDMVEYIRYIGLQPLVIMTKRDKLKASEVEKNTALIKETLSIEDDDVLIPFSSVTKEGRDDILDILDQILERQE